MAQAKTKTDGSTISQFLPKAETRARAPLSGRRIHHRKHPPVNETARDRFVRIGTARMKSALRDIRLLGNLASPNYMSTPEDVKVMRETLDDALDHTFAKFERGARGPKAEEVFQFAD